MASSKVQGQRSHETKQKNFEVPLFLPQDSGAGLVAAGMIAIVPGYISRSVAGSYDNEGIAIFCMLLTYYMWVKSVKTGSLFWSTLCALAYFYMVSQYLHVLYTCLLGDCCF